MKNWKEEYNYRRIKDENGVVTSNIIMIDGSSVEVSEEIYETYSQMHRREVYQEKLREENGEVSFEMLTEKNVPVDIYFHEHSPSAEKIILETEDEAERTVLLSRLPEAMVPLTEEERVLINAIYFDGVSIREYARRNGVTLRAIQKRRDTVLKKLKNFFSENIPQG